MELNYSIRVVSFLRSLAAALIGVASVVSAQEVIPDFYQEPGLQPNRSSVNQHFNEHIDPFTGALQLHYVDINLPGNGGFDLQVIRSYNSSSVDPLNPAAYGAGGSALAGLGWTVHFGRILKSGASASSPCQNVRNDSTDNPVLELPDGSRQMLAFTGNPSPMALTTQRWKIDCAGNGYTVYSPDGVRYDMTQQVNVGSGTSNIQAWYTKKITDRNGNYADVNYAAAFSPEITSVVASDERRIDFSYLSPGTFARRINTITAAGATYTYDYLTVLGVANTFQLQTVTRPGGTTWTYAYFENMAPTAGSYLLQRVKYPENGTLTYVYDSIPFSDGQRPDFDMIVVKTKTASTGGTWSYAYNPSEGTNQLDTTTVTTPAGQIIYKHYGPNSLTQGNFWKIGLLHSKQEGSTPIRTETYTWDAQTISNEVYQRPGRFTDKQDLTTKAPVMTQRVVNLSGASYTSVYSSFDSYGNPQSVSETGPSGNRTTSLSYYINTSKWIIKQLKDQTVSGGIAITRSFDGNGNMESVTKDGVTTSYTYDGSGNVSTATFPRNIKHNYLNYYRGVPKTETQPEGISISRVVSDAGNVTSETKGESQTTGYGYDGLNRVTRITPPQGTQVTIGYSATQKTATRGALQEVTTYDGFGRPVTVTLGGISRTYRYDALGRMTFASNPGALIGTDYQYDITGRVTRITNADSTFQIIGYGAGTKSVTDERSKTTTYTYRSYGEPEEQYLTNIAAPEAAASVSIGRNTKNLVTTLTQDGIARTFDYYTNGYLWKSINPETGTTEFGRDAAGNMTTKKVGSSGVTNYGYDLQNRLTSVTYPDATPSITQSYYKHHRLKTISSGATSRTFYYDPNSNLTTESLTVDGRTYNIVNGYNSLDQLSSITYPQSGRVVDYAPDALGRPTKVGTFVTGIQYWPSGQIKQLDYANGTNSIYGQNSRLWPADFTTQKGAAKYSASIYGYDKVGNLETITDSADASFNRTLTYDGINRLATAAGPWGAGSITYEGGRGNIKTQTFGSNSITYNYDGQNRLGSVTGSRATSFGYDIYGNVTGAWGNTYSYDAGQNLTCVNCSNSVNKINYGYDGMNRRVSVTKAGDKTYELYNYAGHLLVEHTPATSQVLEYIYLGGKRIAQIVPDPNPILLTVSPASAAVNQSVTLNASVTGNAPTGTITFYDGATSLGAVTMSGGAATKTVQFSTPGAKSVTAAYSGNGQNPSGTSVAKTVTVGASSTSLTSTASSVDMTQPFTLSATVTGSSVGGTVTFYDGAVSLGSATLSGGQASKQVSLNSPGSHALTATYSGDALNMTSTSMPVSVSVSNLSQTTTSLSASPAAAQAGKNVTLTATVTGVNPTGTITFRDGGTVLGTGTLSGGAATLTTRFTTIGARSLTASYVSSDGVNQPSTGTLNLSVTVPPEWILPVILQLLDD